MQYFFSRFSFDTRYDAIQYVKENEIYCVNLAEILKQYPTTSKEPLYVAGIYKKNRENNSLCKGIMLISSFGLIFHCIDSDVPETIQNQFCTFFFDQYDFSIKLHAITGLTHSTQIFEQYITKQFALSICASQNYYLMSRTNSSKKKEAVTYSQKILPDLLIRQAKIQDSNALFPLQLAYEQVEVAYNGMKIQPAVCRLALEKSLKTRYMSIAVANNQIIAKAAINGVGFKTIQIGGVYTLPEYRNKGLAKAVITHLINEQSEQKTAVLFVKKHNTAAITVYKKLQFKIVGDFTMSYFQSK